MINDTLISQVKTLSVTERIELIEVVWDSLNPGEIPVSAEEKSMLDVRLADMKQNPEDKSPWAEVQARLKRYVP